MSDRVVKPSVDREVEEELAFHVEMRVRALVDEGMTEDEARREALRMVGDVERIRARMRHEGRRRERRMKRRDGWDGFLQDVRFGWRQLRRAPAFGWVAVLTLGLAIGANTAVFSVVKGVLLEPLPYDRPDEVVTLWTRYLPRSGFDIDRFALSGPEILDLRDELGTVEAMGVYQPGGSRTLTGDGGEAERLSVTFVSAEVLPLLGVRPTVGRVFAAEDDAPGAPPVAVLSHQLWTDRFGQDPEALGRTVLLNGTPTEVVGVMPRDFTFGAGAQAWLPVGLDRSNVGGRAGHGYYGVGRLAPGATLADLDAELDVIADRWASEYEHNVAHFAWAESMRETVLGDAPGTVLLLQVAVALVMLIACANVANLLLARGARRSGEIALRAVLGAGRGRIVRQLVTESAVLAGAAALVGVALAWWATPALIGIAPTALPRLEAVGLDASALAFTAGVAALTVLLFGVLTTSMAGRRAMAGVASSSDRAAGSRGGVRLRRILVGGEVALSLVVVLLAGLLLRSYVARSAEDRGLDANDLLTFSLTLPESGYPEGVDVPVRFRALLDGLAAIPGVGAASGANTLPFDGGYGQWDFQLDDRPPREDGDRAWNAGVAAVAPGYFETLGIPILAGRGIEESDDAGAPWVGVVSETFAETYWPGESAVGKRWGYQQSEDSTTWLTVVGVARDPVMRALGEEPYPFVWMPHAQAGLSGYFWPRTLRVAVRTGVPPESLVPAVREAVRAFDPDLPMYRVRTMEDAVSESLAGPRLATSLLGLFAGLALLLAAVGVYGVVAFSVATRTREIGVRVALGADRNRVVGMVLYDGLAPVLAGVALGLGGAWAATGLVRSMLFGVTPNDTATFLVVPLALLAVATLASWLPARRATRVAPTEALRQE